MPTLKTTASRVWELYSKEIIVFAALVVYITCLAINIVLGYIAAYLWCVLVTYFLCVDGRVPFRWIKSEKAKWVLIFLGPLTLASMCVGLFILTVIKIVFLPYTVFYDTRKQGVKISIRSWSIAAIAYYGFWIAVTIIVYIAVT